MSIEITGLCKSFGGITALHDLTLTVEEGCVTCITGPSGCGKSTLLSILLGLLQPDAGQVKGLEGKRAAAVFQEDRLCERLSAIANILLVCEPEVSPQAACGMLERMGLEKQHHQKPVCDLSGGMRRRVALARALLAKSALEHTGALSCLAAQLSALDPAESDQYYRIVAAYIRSVVRQIEGW